MPTWRRPGTIVLPSPWPLTSADGLSTRRQLRRQAALEIVVEIDLEGLLGAPVAEFDRPGTGLEGCAHRTSSSSSARASSGSMIGMPSADGEGQPGAIADQLLALGIVAERLLGDRAETRISSSLGSTGGPFFRHRLGLPHCRRCRAPAGPWAANSKSACIMSTRSLSSGALEQRLLLARLEGAGHGEAGDQRLVVGPVDRVPVGGETVVFEIGF